MKGILRASLVVVVSAFAVVFGFNAGAAGSALPVYETFDTYTPGDVNNQGAWTVLAGGAGTVAGGDVYLGAQALSGSNVMYTIDDPASSNVWCMLRTKPTLFSQALPTPAALGATSAAFCLSNAVGGAQVYALSNNVWVPVGNPVGASGWIGVALALNYGTHKYDIYSTASTNFNGEFHRLNTSPLSMYTQSGARLTNFVVEGKSFSLDNLVVARGRKTAGLSNVVAIVDNWTAGQTARLGLMPHAYTASENTLDKSASLGADMCMWLTNYDTLGVFVPSVTSFVAYVRTEPDPDGWNPSPNVAPSATHIEPGTGVTLTKASTGPLAMFFDYDSLTTYETKTVVGTATAGGLNYLCYDRSEQSPTLGGGLGFNTIAGRNDRLYVNGKMYYWDGGWRQSGSLSSDTLPPFATFWYKRGSAAGSANWDVGTAQ